MTEKYNATEEFALPCTDWADAYDHIMDVNNPWFTIKFYDWMINRLDLRINHIGVFAVIYKFSSKGQPYDCGRKALAKLVRYKSMKSVDTALKKLIEKNLIKKTDVFKNGVKHCEYRHNPEELIKLGVDPEYAWAGVTDNAH